ncbi:439_t:CDS:2, partial [Racocetra fulgida]
MDSSILSFKEVANEIDEEQDNSEAGQLYIGKSFLSWEEVTLFLDEYCKQQGFGYRKGHSKKSNDQDVKKRTFLCRYSETFVSNKTAPPEEQRNTPSCRNRLEVDNFERHYSELVESYSIAQNYLRYLYKSRKAWARYYTSSYFTAGMQSTMTLFEDSECITKFLQERQTNSEFILWKESMLLISLPNIYNTIFSNIDVELRAFISLPIVNKMREQMNLSFLYRAKESTNDFAFEQDRQVDCETSCLDEIFDLPQVSTSRIFREFYDQIVSIWEVFHISMINRHWYKDQFYNSNVDDRQFIQLGIPNNDHNYFLMKWTPSSSIDVHRFSYNEIEQVQSHIKEKQCYAKVFGLAKALVNKAIEFELDKKLIALLEKFKINEIIPNLCSQHQNNGTERESTQRLDSNSYIEVKNLTTKKRKGRPRGARRILSSIEVNQQLTKSRSNRCKNCGEQGYNIRSCKKKHNDSELESDSADSESENDSENLTESDLENKENQ